MTTLAQSAVDQGSTETRSRSRGGQVTALVDLVALVVLTAFASWTVLYLLALAGIVSSAVAFWGWVVLVPVAVVLVVRRLRGVLDAVAPSAPWIPLGIGVLAAVAALVVVRPDLDDASYVVRSAWIAAHGDVRVGDVIFSGGRWPGMANQTPYLPSVEALLGWLSRVTGLSAGTVVYVVLPPLAAFLGVWALNLLFRAWGTRRPAACLALAALFLVMGGADHASWGNLNVARIWQGKVLFLSLVVPLVFALAAAFWSAESRRVRRAALVLVAVAGIAGVGLSPAATFVAPGVMAVCLVPGLVRRRWADALRLFAAGAGPALVAGSVVLAAGPAREGPVPGPATENPWFKVLGTGVPAVVVAGAAVVSVLACLAPRRWAAGSPVAAWTCLAAVVAGSAIWIPQVYGLAARVMGTDAIAWRLTWLVPVPALVGLLAGLPRWSRVPVGPIAGVLAALALVWGGLPIWSADNGAHLARPPAWKIASADLAAARWAAAQDSGGRVLAPTAVSAALGVVDPDVRPVGSRLDYMAHYLDQPGARMPERAALQRLADGGADPADLAAAPRALADLDVAVTCGAPDGVLARQVLLPAGYEKQFSEGPISCYTRTR
jgi:hypothetical protein